jgi:hypothetical protein
VARLGYAPGQEEYVYSCRVHFKSSSHIEAPEQSIDLVTGYHGLIFIDSANHFVHRITLQADEIPLSSPIPEISMTLDYAYARIGDGDDLMRLQFELRSRGIPRSQERGGRRQLPRFQCSLGGSFRFARREQGNKGRKRLRQTPRRLRLCELDLLRLPHFAEHLLVTATYRVELIWPAVYAPSNYASVDNRVPAASGCAADAWVQIHSGVKS